jgi:uncharacterized protein (DUF1330 family)
MTMPAYALFDVLEVTDQAKMGQYRQGVLATIQKYGGRVIVAGGKFEIVEGSAKPTFPVILEFPTLEAAKRWYDSEEYRSPESVAPGRRPGQRLPRAGRLTRRTTNPPSPGFCLSEPEEHLVLRQR